MTFVSAVILLLGIAGVLGIAEALRLAGGRRALGVAAAAAAPVLLYFVLYPPLQNVAGRPLRVLTAGAAAGDAAPDADTIALPGADAPAGVARAPDLATALRRHPDASGLAVYGAGLDAADRDAARGRSLRFEAAALPRGIVALEVPDDIRAGHGFALSGRVAQPEGLRIALREPGGQRRDPVALNADGRFTFALFAPRAAELSYELSLLDASGADVERLAVPVSVRDGTTLRLLLLAGGPDADLKYLQRWALDAGHTVDARIALSRGLSQQRGDVSVSDDALAATDVVVIDDRAWTQLDKAARAKLLAAVDSGLGLLLRLGNAPSAALVAQWRELGLPLESTDLAPAVHLAGEPADTAATAQRLALRIGSGDALVLAQDRDGAAVAAARQSGHGRLGVWWIYDSGTLVLGGQAALHDALWARALDQLARPRQAAAPTAPGQIWQYERATLCAREDVLRVATPSGSMTTLLTQRGSDERWCGGFWPRETGWHTVQSGTAQTRFFVRTADDAAALHRAQTASATRALAGGAAPAVTASVAGPRWPWFLAWLVPATLLWWLQRSRARRTS